LPVAAVEDQKLVASLQPHHLRQIARLVERGRHGGAGGEVALNMKTDHGACISRFHDDDQPLRAGERGRSACVRLSCSQPWPLRRAIENVWPRFPASPPASGLRPCCCASASAAGARTRRTGLSPCPAAPVRRWRRWAPPSLSWARFCPPARTCCPPTGSPSSNSSRAQVPPSTSRRYGPRSRPLWAGRRNRSSPAST